MAMNGRVSGFDYCVSATNYSLFVHVRSVFNVMRTDIKNINEENGYCVMMVLADSKNVIKIFFFLRRRLLLRQCFFSSLPLLLLLRLPFFLFSGCCCTHQNQ